MTKKRGTKTKSHSVPRSSIGIEKALIENFISLQRVMVNLSGKFDNLATQITKLLELFEISAKALAEKNFAMSGNRGDEKVIQKIDTLLDQNKVIARGLTLMHEVNSRQGAPLETMEYQSQPAQGSGAVSNQQGVEGYQKSIASEDNIGNFDSPMPSGDRKFRKLPKG